MRLQGPLQAGRGSVRGKQGPGTQQTHGTLTIAFSQQLQTAATGGTTGETQRCQRVQEQRGFIPRILSISIQSPLETLPT